MTERDAVLSRIKTVPSLPSVLVKLRQYLNDPEVSFDQLSRVIEYDPGLTANVLQLANSAYFGWSGRIKTIKEAVIRLGTNRVFQMVLCMSVAPLVRKPVKGYDVDSEGLWRHSIATAICAEQLVQALEIVDLDEAFTAGLLHDMGKIVLGTFVEADDEPIKELMAKDDLAFNEAERMVLGIDHAEVAAELLRAWSLPGAVVAAARWHHEPEHADHEHRILTDVIHVADYLCLNFGWGGGGDVTQYRFDDRARERLKLDVATAEQVGECVQSGMEELGSLFAPTAAGTPSGGG